MASAKLAQPAAGSGLEFGLDFPLPETVAVGGGTALFLCGWCFAPGARIRGLRVAVDGDEQPLSAWGMPRREVAEAIGGAPEPAYRSGFWGLARVAPGRAGDDVELELRARTDGRVQPAALARVPRADLEPPIGVDPPGPPGRRVAICMAAYEPPPELFRRQIDSIRAQTHADWVCVISDDGSSPAGHAAMRDAIGDDPRFHLSRAPARLGFYRNFERALALAPAGADYVAMADQDDLWHADKLEVLLDRIGAAQLVYSDARIVDSGGAVVSDTYWSVRRNNHTDLFSVLSANSITGAASLFRRDLLARALPFPPAQFGHFHDHWVGLTALALGDIAYVDRPLYDYTQHRGAVIGHAAAVTMPALGDRLRGLRRPLRERIGRWRLTYFNEVWRIMQLAAILDLRCGADMAPDKRRALHSFVAAERSPLALGRFLGRAARELTGRPETLGAELGLFFGFSWRHLSAAAGRGPGAPGQRPRLDVQPPPRLFVKPGRRDADVAPVRDLAARIEPLDLVASDRAPRRVNVLIPKVDLRHFFGGYLGKFNLARRLAERGARVRILTVDPVGPLPRDWRARVESYSGLDGLFDRVEVEFGREAGRVEVSRDDAFVATTWWTAHVAGRALERVAAERFLYLVQEYEPFTFGMGSLAALAEGSYRLPHAALFSTELLRDFFRGRGIGVYAGGPAAGDERSAAFRNAITAVAPPAADELAARSGRRLLFYARPEQHAARNMFELGAIALARAAEEGVLDGWELRGVGTVGHRRRVGIGGGATLELLPRAPQASYADLLRSHDVGLALMYTPHPSLVPIEMAAAGMLVVTNSFENKTPDALAAISPNLIAADPTVDGIVAALRAAVEGAGDAERRARGGRVDWPRSWDESLPDDLMRRVETLLGL